MSKVLCPGEILIDFFVDKHGTYKKNGFTYAKKAGGASANVAIAVEKLGGQAVFLGAVGDDDHGDFLINTLRKYNTSIRGTSRLKTNTTLAYVTLFEDGERNFDFIEGAASMYSFDMIDDDLLEGVSIVHFGSAMAFMGDKLEETYDELLEYAMKHELIISFDPNYRDVLFPDNLKSFISKSRKYIKHADIVKVSEEEALIISEKDNINDAGSRLVELGAKYVLITLGSKGTLLVSKDGYEHIQVKPVTMIDATGAGDAFIGAVLAKLSLSKDLSIDAIRKYVEYGNKVGAITVQSKGALDSIPFHYEVK